MENDTEVPTCAITGCAHLATRGNVCLTHYVAPKPPAELSARIAQYVARVVSDAPPLSAGQRDRVALLLRAAK